ncbi:MAG: hypothetical protein VX815_09615 [Gemmatimonadota bacterium]|nr:hypothetical protein [Gemmatimonadota bacterium]
MTPDALSIPRIPSLGRLVSFTFVLSVLAGCDDAGTDPLARLVAEESAGALALGVTLPDPGAWVVPEAATPEAADAAELWTTSWDLPGDEGHAVRAGNYVRLAELFVPEFGRGGISEQLDGLWEGVRRAQELPGLELPERIRQRIMDASRAHARAREALLAERLREAMVQLLIGSDALREVGPEAVARTMVSEVDTELRRISLDETYTEQDLDRLGRLVRGGRDALAEQDWVRAIRRAYYAKGYAKGLLASGGA